MRSRYSAYALGEVDYIVRSHDPATSHQVDRKSTELWSKSSKWLGFELVSSEGGTAFDQDATIEFVARYKIRGVTVEHRERARFASTMRAGFSWMARKSRDRPGFAKNRASAATSPVRAAAARNTRNATVRALARDSQRHEELSQIALDVAREAATLLMKGFRSRPRSRRRRARTWSPRGTSRAND